ncbi:MAG TPA: hypothetical protein VGI13_13220 [Candidatus Acidoferrum sp.]
MAMGRFILAAILAGSCVASTAAQNDKLATMRTALPPVEGVGVDDAQNEMISLTVPKGTAVQVVLDKQVRIRKVGQEVHGRVAEQVYAFDKLVVPVGTEVIGKITELESVGNGKRTLDALNAEFTPPRKVQIEFTELKLANGRQIPIHTSVTPGSGQVIQFITAADPEKKGVKGEAAKQADQAKQQAKDQWDHAMAQVQEPGKIEKLKKYAISQLPAHPQYIEAGTVYFAELQQSLDFGSEPLTPEIAASINTPPPPGSSVRVRLVAEMSSATAKKGDPVEAVLSRPLFAEDRLILPQGSLLKGTVVQVQPARSLSRNGQLRMVFHELVLPDGIEQKVETSLEGVQAGKNQDVKLDSEGGAEANTPKTRYLATGVSVMLALASAHTDADARPGDVGGSAGARGAGGLGGFKLVGLAMGIFVHSQPLGMAMGAYGASVSIYSHFIARGRELVFPKNTAMQVAIGTRTPAPPQGSAESSKPIER